MESSSNVDHRSRIYCGRYRLQRLRRLGFGIDATVWEIVDGFGGTSALKVHRRPERYRAERDVYLRLAELRVMQVLGHNVPVMLRTNDELLAIEMTVVRRPFALDFASAHLDAAPSFPDEVWDHWREEKQEQFGSHWPHVMAILTALQRYGIHVLDAHPGNIAFEEDAASP